MSAIEGNADIDCRRLARTLVRYFGAARADARAGHCARKWRTEMGKRWRNDGKKRGKLLIALRLRRTIGKRVAIAGEHALDHGLLGEVQEDALA